ncbi:uncharacterized protein LOC111058355 isoform X4 [Nilaparvata lugens]|uniref:uncharacterized protein LOC111058355 isoform X4 n=1 Tax=Nilaparvata lugens TaxID=108931 RepID=UPI00193EB92B|nr:uncharacterized protein LOC111058355 isoform X4 [Nilaparvata lugens]
MTSSHVSTQTNQFHHDNQIIQCIWDSKSSIQTPAGAVCCSISKLHPPLQFLGGSDSPIHACTMLNKIRKIQVSTSTSKFQLGLEASSVQLFSTEKDFIDASTSFALKAGGVGLGHGWIVRDTRLMLPRAPTNADLQDHSRMSIVFYQHKGEGQPWVSSLGSQLYNSLLHQDNVAEN